MLQIRTQSRTQVSLEKKVAEGHLPKEPDKHQTSREAQEDKACIRVGREAKQSPIAIEEEVEVS